MTMEKNLGELSDEILFGLGFVKVLDEEEDYYWTHPESSVSYFQILTPQAVADILIKIGYTKAKSHIVEYIKHVDLDSDSLG